MRDHASLLLGLAVAALAVLLVGSSSIAGAETYQLPPVYVIEWDFVPEKGFIANAVWSPNGSYLAVVVNHVSGGRAYSEIIVMDRTGEIIWRTKLGPLNPNRVVWSSDGREIAALTLSTKALVVIDVAGKKARELPYRGVYAFSWSPSNHSLLALGLGNRVVVVRDSGEKVWEKRIPGAIAAYGVSWSPRGDMLAVNTGNGVVVLDSRGNMVSRYSAGKERVITIKWSLEAGLMAVKQRYAGDRIVVVEASTGKPRWSTGRGTIYGYEWSPSGKTLLVAGIELVLYDGYTGKTLWSIKWVKKVGVVTPYQAAWSPDGKLVVVVKNGELVLIDPRTANIVWRDGLGLDPAPRLLGLSRTNRILLLQENRHGRIIVLGPVAKFSSIYIENCPRALACSVIVKDPAKGITKHYTGTDYGVLRLYATPGRYELVFKILRLPSGYKAVGVLDVAEKTNYTRTLDVVAQKDYRIKAPIEKLVKKILDNMAQLVVEAPPGTKLRLRKGLASYDITIDKPGETIYVSPGTYLVSYSIPGGKGFHLLGRIVLEKNKPKRIMIKEEKPTTPRITTTTHTATGRTQTTGSQETGKPATTTPVASSTTQSVATTTAGPAKTSTKGSRGGGYTLAIAIAGLLVLIIIAAIALSRGR